MGHFSGDGAYDETPVYAAIIEHSYYADVAIPPRANPIENDKAAPERNHNIIKIEKKGSMQWDEGLSNKASLQPNYT